MKNRGIRAILILAVALGMFSCVSDRNNYIEGYKLWKKKKYEAAISKFQEIAFKKGRSKYKIPSHFNIGSIYYYQLERHELAAIEFTKVTALSDEKSEYGYKAQMNIADIYRKEFKSYERAIYEYKLLFNYEFSRKDLLQIFDSIYACYVEEKLYNDAQDEFKNFFREFDLTPAEKGRLYMINGNIASLRGKWKDAVSFYENASEIEEFKNEGYFMIAETYYSRKKYKQAEQYYRFLINNDYKKEIVQEKLEFINGK